MSSGGLLQLVAYGSQDVYLTGSPQITFFRVVYRRHKFCAEKYHPIDIRALSFEEGLRTRQIALLVCAA